MEKVIKCKKIKINVTILILSSTAKRFHKISERTVVVYCMSPKKYISEGRKLQLICFFENWTLPYAPSIVVLFMMARPKDRKFWALGMIAGTKDRTGSVAITVLSIPLFKF